MRRSVLSRCAAVMAAVMLLCTMIFAAAAPVAATEETGSITVKVKPEYEGIPYCLVDIADMTGGEVSLYDEFSSLDITSEDLNGINSVLAEKLKKAEKFFMENGITGEIGRIDMEGNVKFTNVPLSKLYILYQPIGKEQVDLTPVLVPMPCVDASTGEVTKDVSITAKKTEPAQLESMGSVILNKTDQDEVRLEGAVFVFYKKIYYTDDSMITDDLEIGEDETGKFYWKKFDVDFTTNKQGQISVSGLAFGDYRVVETKAPEGYVIDDAPFDFTISQPATIKVENDYLVPDLGVPVELNIVNYPEVVTESSDSEDSIIDEESQMSGGGMSIDETSMKASYPTPSQATSYVPDGKVTVEITGEDMAKYIIIGAIVGVSLLLVIILAVVGSKKGKKNDKDE